MWISYKFVKALQNLDININPEQNIAWNGKLAVPWVYLTPSKIIIQTKMVGRPGSSLVQVMVTLNHLIESNQFTRPGAEPENISAWYVYRVRFATQQMSWFGPQKYLAQAGFLARRTSLCFPYGALQTKVETMTCSKRNKNLATQHHCLTRSMQSGTISAGI